MGDNFMKIAPIVAGTVIGAAVGAPTLGAMLSGALSGGGMGLTASKMMSGLSGNDPVVPSPGALNPQPHKGIPPPQFQFQTVGVQPAATIGTQRGSQDILDLLRRLQSRG